MKLASLFSVESVTTHARSSVFPTVTLMPIRDERNSEDIWPNSLVLTLIKPELADEFSLRRIVRLELDLDVTKEQLESGGLLKPVEDCEIAEGSTLGLTCKIGDILRELEDT